MQQFNPWNWTHFGSGKLLLVRESTLDKATDSQDKRLLSPWADALARQELMRKLQSMPVQGEA